MSAIRVTLRTTFSFLLDSALVLSIAGLANLLLLSPFPFLPLGDIADLAQQLWIVVTLTHEDIILCRDLLNTEML